MEDISTVLSIVKARLNRLADDTTIDDYLIKRINAADNELKHTGIIIDEADAEDLIFISDFVVWQYQNRDNPRGMPDWLRLRRRERFIQQLQRGDAP